MHVLSFFPTSPCLEEEMERGTAVFLKIKPACWNTSVPSTERGRKGISENKLKSLCSALVYSTSSSTLFLTFFLGHLFCVSICSHCDVPPSLSYVSNV